MKKKLFLLTFICAPLFFYGQTNSSPEKPFRLGIDLFSGINRSTLQIESEYFIKDFFSVNLGFGNQFSRNKTTEFTSDSNDLKSNISINTKGYFVNPGVRLYYISKVTNRPTFYIGLNLAIINYDYSGETQVENYYGKRTEKFSEPGISLLSKDLAFGACMHFSENVGLDFGAKLISFTQRKTENTGAKYSIPYIGLESGTTNSNAESIVHFQFNAALKYSF